MLSLQLMVKWVLSHLKKKNWLVVQSVEDGFSRRLCEVVFNFVVFILMQG